MNYVDFTILLIAVVGFLYGLIKGVIRQVGMFVGRVYRRYSRRPIFRKFVLCVVEGDVRFA